MFANRFTVLVDACSLVPVLGRNLLLSLAQADFFRVRWSAKILDETEIALAGMFSDRNIAEPEATAKKHRMAMERAFGEALVSGYESLILSLDGLPDPDDAHVVAAAVKIRASVIVTENLKDFPACVLEPLDLEAKSSDAFIADTISLDTGKAVAAIRTMRKRLKRPETNVEALLLDLDARGFLETVDALRGHTQSL